MSRHAVESGGKRWNVAACGHTQGGGAERPERGASATHAKQVQRSVSERSGSGDAAAWAADDSPGGLSKFEGLIALLPQRLTEML